MAVPVVVLLTNELLVAVARQLLAPLPATTEEVAAAAAELRDALIRAALTTDQAAPQPDLFGSTP